MLRPGAAPLLLLSLALAGCGTGNDGPMVATHDTVEEVGDQALLEGSLDLDGDCVTVVEAGTGEVWVPIFPRKLVSMKAEGLEWRGELYEDGDTIALGGGFVDDSVPQACPTESFTVSSAS
ncbi:hypothetical protein [Cellulomonas sp. Leaf334]|uniref:hypothetical protein n=1 Tax=Cellulomonas sp. Leaf334 TaxID=1736339 RepID=UPI0006F5F763|nr:hypothetical protein [Cellulomonas sp. Leaf334]KQR16924.1 hypothetical protein ASF78_06220 [Cellulomonas sp. Leaf334]